MAVKIEFHHEAAAEYDASFDRYLEQSPEAARKFDDELERALSQIRKALSNGRLVPGTRAGTCSADFHFF